MVRNARLVGFSLLLIVAVSRCSASTSENAQPAVRTPTASPETNATPVGSSTTQTAEPTSSPSPSLSEIVETNDSPALIAAQALEVRGRSSATSYSRDAFGAAWIDVDHNGCDTRNDILARDFTSVIYSGTGAHCKVIGGTWTDPYSNQSYTFDSAPSGAQIDHVVALKNAWQMGADLWEKSQRITFANDPLNLRVTIASLNRSKSDSNAASWLPPYKPGRCAFIAQQVAVKAKWHLFVTEAEKVIMVQVLSSNMCANTSLPE
jgi:hypothetical protein